ncbi:thioredoxin family protein [Peribacillus saganii]|uniref:Thioredoxin family protein n=1 Tax=Peribacillus saganii TaxID=2303992 RepID=A0A372LLR2_9BACI|nr:thioredoxin family protein [Peribacillus saganii]RFU67920.1 thioredoxin family protein [Peribacillus saganii]
MSSLNSWFEKGMTKEEYLDSMKVHKENLKSVQENFQLDIDDEARLAPLKENQLRAIVLTADWCGDAMVNIPILLNIASSAGIDIRFLIRDENLELMDQYLTNGTARSIPIFIFIDSNGDEVARWGPRAPEVQAFVDDLKENTMPAKEDPAYNSAFKLFIETVTNRFITDQELWTSIKSDILKTLENSILKK